MKGEAKRFAEKKLSVAIFSGMVFLCTISPLSMAGEPTSPPKEMASTSAVGQGQCPEIVALLAEQEQKNAKEFRGIKRDIAALSQQMAEPGMREIFGGFGYILGLFGVAAYVASRKKADGGGR